MLQVLLVVVGSLVCLILFLLPSWGIRKQYSFFRNMVVLVLAMTVWLGILTWWISQESAHEKRAITAWCQTNGYTLVRYSSCYANGEVMTRRGLFDWTHYFTVRVEGGQKRTIVQVGNWLTGSLSDEVIHLSE